MAEPLLAPENPLPGPAWVKIQKFQTMHIMAYNAYNAYNDIMHIMHTTMVILANYDYMNA